MVVYSETYDGLDFALYQFVEYAVVVALVLAADYPYYRLGLALERVPCRIYIRCLGIIDVQYPAYAQYRFETVLDRRETLEAVADYLYFALLVFVPPDDFVVVEECSLLHFLLL